MTEAEEFWDREVEIREKEYENLDKYTVLGIMKQVNFGNDDHGLCLSFAVMINESIGSTNYLFYPAYEHFMKRYGVTDVKDLNGKPVWMLKDKYILTVLKPAIF